MDEVLFDEDELVGRAMDEASSGLSAGSSRRGESTDEDGVPGGGSSSRRPKSPRV